MKLERWSRVEELYHSAIKQNESQRSRFLEEETAGDENLRREVESLLALQEKSESFLETSALQATVQMVTGDRASIDGQDQVLTMLFSSELGSASPELLVTTQKGHARSVLLEGDPLFLGRSPDNDLAFPEDDGLSRRHLAIESGEDGWTVRDLGSKNGTFVNGDRLEQSHILRPGDRISASCITLTYRGASHVKD
jgi:hypothetical protein